MERVKLEVRLREGRGTKDAKAMREAGDIPGVIYSQQSETEAIAINARALQVPHPRLHERRFALAPMAELAPTLMHPKLNASISELLAALKSPHRVTLARADLLRPPQPRREAALR